MDGRMAMLFLALSAFDGANHHKDTHYFTKKPLKDAHIAISLGEASVNNYTPSKELGINYHFDYTYGAWRPVLSSSVTERGAVWLGYGGEVVSHVGNAYFSSYLLPGVYHKGNDINLGSALEFKSGIEFGYRFGKQSAVGIGYDHRSNADLGRINPGMESIYLRYYARY